MQVSARIIQIYPSVFNYTQDMRFIRAKILRTKDTADTVNSEAGNTSFAMDVSISPGSVSFSCTVISD